MLYNTLPNNLQSLIYFLSLALTQPTQAFPTATPEQYSPCTRACILNFVSSTYCVLGPSNPANTACLCSKRAYLTNIAQCVYRDCGLLELQKTAQINSDRCDEANATSVLDTQQFIIAGDPSAPGHGGNNSDASPRDDDNDHHISPGVIVAIAVGIIIAIPSLLLAVVEVARACKLITFSPVGWLRQRCRRPARHPRSDWSDGGTPLQDMSRIPTPTPPTAPHGVERVHLRPP